MLDLTMHTLPTAPSPACVATLLYCIGPLRQCRPFLKHSGFQIRSPVPGVRRQFVVGLRFFDLHSGSSPAGVHQQRVYRHAVVHSQNTNSKAPEFKTDRFVP